MIILGLRLLLHARSRSPTSFKSQPLPPPNPGRFQPALLSLSSLANLVIITLTFGASVFGATFCALVRSRRPCLGVCDVVAAMTAVINGPELVTKASWRRLDCT